MRILKEKKLYLPAFSILASVFILLVFISISTYRNLNQEKKTALEFLHRQGVTLLHALEAGARAGMMTPMWKEDSIESLVIEIARNEDIVYIYLTDPEGVVVHSSNPPFRDLLSAWKPQFKDPDHIQGRVRERADGTQVYDLAKRFSPLASLHEMGGNNSMMGWNLATVPQPHPDMVIILGLKMTAFDAARRADFNHSIIMAAIVVVLGSGTLFFIFVIQNYYLVNKTLKQTEDYTQKVVASMANGLLSIDLEGNVISYNVLALELLDLDESEMGETNVYNLAAFKPIRIRDNMTGGGSILEQEIDYRGKSGERVPLSFSLSPIRDDNDVCSGGVILLRDLREIKHLEEALRRSEKFAAIGKLAAAVAHEIRNPLSSIRGFARFLGHALSDRPEQREYAEVMVKEVDRINKVVTDLLDFARPMDPEFEPTGIKDLIDHSVRMVEADAQAQNTIIRISVSPGLTEFLLDASQMIQALLNLLLNSLQAVEAEGNIEVGAALDTSDTQLNIWVQDDGPGIPDDYKETLFDLFVTSREKGTGLGLVIVRKIIDGHRGNILVESPVPGKDRGSRFTIMIPVHQPEGEARPPDAPE